MGISNWISYSDLMSTQTSLHAEARHWIRCSFCFRRSSPGYPSVHQDVQRIGWRPMHFAPAERHVTKPKLCTFGNRRGVIAAPPPCAGGAHRILLIAGRYT